MARIGAVMAIAITSMACPVSAAPDTSANDQSTEAPRLRVFAEDADLGAGASISDEAFNDNAPTSARREAAPQVIVAPLPPAVLTALPLLGAMWTARRYRMWRRGA